MNTKHTPMEIKAARAFNKSMAETCNVDAEDQWKYHSETIIADVKVVIDCIGAQELLEALTTILENDGGEGSKCYHAIKLYDAREQAISAIAKATGESNE